MAWEPVGRIEVLRAALSSQLMQPSWDIPANALLRTVRRRVMHVTSALRRLYQNHIVHPDVKLENIVHAGDACAKHTGFGCACYLNQSNTKLNYFERYFAIPSPKTRRRFGCYFINGNRCMIFRRPYFQRSYCQFFFNAVHSRDHQPIKGLPAELVIRSHILHFSSIVENQPYRAFHDFCYPIHVSPAPENFLLQD